MNIEIKEFYRKNITVVIDPHDIDIRFGFLSERKVENLKMPCTFLSGKIFKMYYNCLSCNNEIVTTSEEILSGADNPNLGFLQTGINRDIHFLEAIYNLFPNIKKVTQDSYLYLKSDNAHGIFRLFYVKCPHCRAKYLGICIYIYPIIPDRGECEPSPAKVYLDNIAWVDFNEKEFYKAAGIK
ncbi:MAG: hypothetical protein QM660_09095 [Dysgonomonas sp.]